jgi:glycosyltransferase involved in cell wall biosynthesis
MSNKKILLVCWDFPPNKGIGGRRWAKFAKGLVNQGFQVHVIKSAPVKNNETSPWFKDVNDEKISMYELQTFWAVKWLHDYSSPLSFLKIRIAQFYLRIFFKGTIYDKAIGCQQKFLSLAKKIISTNGIKNVIVTGAPFNLIHYSALLKHELQQLNIIADYRDPWLNSVNYGMNYLNEVRKSEECQKQNFVFENIDIITAPNQFLIEQIKQTYTGNKNTLPKFITLSHIFDPDDFVKQEKINKEAGKLKLVYAGALYTDSEKYLNLLYTSISNLKRAFPDLRIELDIYTEHKSTILLTEYLEGVVKFIKPVGDKIFNFISKYDMIIILLTDHNKDFKTTKFFEFLPYKLPYLYVGPSGFVSESIEKEKLGFVIKNGEDLVSIYQNLSQIKGDLDGFQHIDEYSLDMIVKGLVNQFK